MAKIGFIGLGNMGGPMAVNLVKYNHQVVGFDLSESAMKELKQAGGEVAASVTDAVQNADVVISMLPSGSHVAALYLDPQNGLIHSLNKDTLVIDSSTIDAATARKVHAELASQSIRFVDAPVSGGVGGALAGSLTFIVGGEASAFKDAQPILQGMGKNIFHAGQAGAGQVAKICNNMLLSVLMLGTSEALQLAIDNGLDAKVISEIMLESSGRNWTLELYNPCPDVMPNVPSSNNYQGGFMVDLMCKDLRLALDTALNSQSSTPLGSLAQSLYAIHGMQGNGKKDFSSIFELFSRHNTSQQDKG